MTIIRLPTKLALPLKRLIGVDQIVNKTIKRKPLLVPTIVKERHVWPIRKDVCIKNFEQVAFKKAQLENFPPGCYISVAISVGSNDYRPREYKDKFTYLDLYGKA